MHLPEPRGPLSEWVVSTLGQAPPARQSVPDARPDDALRGDDLHLALYLLYELHYARLTAVDAAWEWDPGLIAVRNRLERPFVDALVELAGHEEEPAPDEVVPALLDIVRADSGPSVARYAELHATLEQFCEFVIHRSAYQLKEGDPHTWVIPRLWGPAKAAFVEIQADEYGSGHPSLMHSTLFAKTMLALDLDPTYGAYLDRIPGVTLATVNLVSMFGLHARWRGAAVGHLVAFESSSSEPNRRYGNALRRLGFGHDATHFYDEHVEADSGHEVIALHDVAGALVRSEPNLAGDIVFGARALAALEGLWGDFALGCWRRGETSLRSPVGAPSPA